MRAPEQQMAFGPDRDSNRDTRAPEGQNQHRAGHGTVGCPLEQVGGGALERLKASCVETEGTTFMWVPGGLRAQGSHLHWNRVLERDESPHWPFRGVRRLV